jgi:hypothetical protein
MERHVINSWLEQPVAASVEAVALEIATEHQLRWRLANLMPEQQTIRALADAWKANRQISVDPTTTRMHAASSAASALKDRSRLLESQFLNPDSTVHETNDFSYVDAGDVALLRGEDVRARDEFLREISESGHLDAWIGLMLALRRIGVLDGSLSTQHPIEVIVAVHEYIRSRRGKPSDIQSMVLWIRDTLATSR